MQMTPLRAIRKHCIECAGSPGDVKNCGGDKMLGGGRCLLYPYHMGKGRPSVKLIRRYCIQCMGGSRLFVAECPRKDCTLYPYRFGKNPAMEGKVNVGSFQKHNASRDFWNENRIRRAGI